MKPAEKFAVALVTAGPESRAVNRHESAGQKLIARANGEWLEAIDRQNLLNVDGTFVN